MTSIGPARVDAVRLLPLEPRHGLEDPVPDDDLTRALTPSGRVHQPGAPDIEVGHAAGEAFAAGGAPGPPPTTGPAPATPASRYSNAIRIATPFVT